MLASHPGWHSATSPRRSLDLLVACSFCEHFESGMSYWQFNFQKSRKRPPLSKEMLFFFFSIYFNYHLIKIGTYYSKHWHELSDYIFLQCLYVNNIWKLYLVLILNQFSLGHVDAGKSTLMGHMLYLLGNVNKRTMHKYEQESKKAGKASFAYAWVLDETGEERER